MHPLDIAVIVIVAWIVIWAIHKAAKPPATRLRHVSSGFWSGDRYQCPDCGRVQHLGNGRCNYRGRECPPTSSKEDN